MSHNAIAALLALASLPAAAQNFVAVTDNGDPGNRVDLLFIAEGYTTAELGKFAADVANATSSFFQQEPYREYRYYYNVGRLDVESAESGADHPPQVFRNTAFDAAYNCASIPRLICVSSFKVNAALAQVPANRRDIVIVLVNDPEYGGSGGQFAVSSTNSESIEISLHEIGHSFALLADEYGGPPPPACIDSSEPSEANATRQTQRSMIKWNAWIDPSTPIETFGTSAATPGLYRGSRYCDNTLFRPTYQSKMRSLGVPFEQINTEQHIRRIYAFVSPIESVSPAGSAVTMTGVEQRTFSVATPATFSLPLRIEWALDGVLAGTNPDFVLNAGTIASGAHTLTVAVSDRTPMVRTAPAGLLSEQFNWNITVQGGRVLPGVPGNPAPADGAANVPLRPMLAWSAAANSTSYVVYFGTTADSMTRRGEVAGTAVAMDSLAGILANATTYYWRIVAVNANGSTSSPTWSFTTAAAGALQPLRLVAVTPCRVVDTRAGEGFTGLFGPPGFAAESNRTLPIPAGRCGIPTSARAYSVNITVVPSGPLYFLTAWPTGRPRPPVSTLNSFDGKVVANAAIVPVGSNGAIDVFVTNATDVVVDINGYFAP